VRTRFEGELRGNKMIGKVTLFSADESSSDEYSVEMTRRDLKFRNK
jgi:hypothetical protein